MFNNYSMIVNHSDCPKGSLKFSLEHSLGNINMLGQDLKVSQFCMEFSKDDLFK